MIWKSKITPKFKEGQKRVISKFAWFPEKLSDGWTVWLEFYNIEQVLAYGPYYIKICDRMIQTTGLHWQFKTDYANFRR